MIKLPVYILRSQPSMTYQITQKMLIDDPRLANELMLTACDPNLNFQLTSLAKPNWPRSTPTIPCMFYKNLNESVCFYN